MDRAKSLEFLQNCINSINKMDISEIEELKQVYRTEMEDTLKTESGFEVILPSEIETFDYPSVELDSKLNEKMNINYNTSQYEEVNVTLFECIAA